MIMRRPLVLLPLAIAAALALIAMEPEPDLLPETEEERVQARDRLSRKPLKTK